MINELKNIKSAKSDLKKFGITVGIVLFIIGIAQWYFGREIYIYFLNIGIVLIILGLIIPIILMPLQKLWMGIAVIIGWFIFRIILSILFYLIFTPISFLNKMLGNKFLELTPDVSKTSYWSHWDQEDNDRKGCEKQY